MAGPIPGMARNGIIPTNSSRRDRGMRSMPSGLAIVDASFATTALDAMPTEHVTWKRALTSARIHRAIAVGRPHASRAEDTSI